jgi:glycosyltransferase involved in cell wall biosynthesis
MIGAHERHEERVMMKAVGWVVPGPLRQVTGGYLYDARIVDGLRARGRRVGVIDLGSSGWPLDRAAGRRLIRAVERERWGALVVDELAHPALAAALAGGRLRRALAGAPLVLLVHHLRCSEPGPAGSRGLATVVERLVVRAADLVVCTSATTASTVDRLVRGGVRVEVVRPGWDTHGAPEGPTSQPPPHRGGEGETAGRLLPLSTAVGRGLGGGASPAVRLLLVGHWTPRKGILEALDALGRVRVPVCLDLVGEQDRDPAYASRVWQALQEPGLRGRVQMHGRVSSEELRQRFAEADALLLTSSHEGYGMVLAEALAAGLPIVATRVGAVPEVVRDGQEAELVAPGDAWALARAITRLAADPDERCRRAHLARARAAGLPRWSDGIEAFDRLLSGVAT